MSKQENGLSEKDLASYRDPEGLSLKDMSIGLWLSVNRRRLLKILTIFLVIVSAGLIIFSVYNYLIYFLNPGDQEIDPQVSAPRQRNEAIQASALSIFKSGSNFDLAVLLKNPNDRFFSGFNYCFKKSGENVVCGQSFILPGGEKYVYALNQDLGGDASGVSFEINNVFWQRINAHEISDWESYRQSRLDFKVNNISFNQPDSYAAANQDYNHLDFEISNPSPFGYYDVPLTIALFQGSELVGINSYHLANFISGNSQQVSLSWPGKIRASRVDIQPDINIIDDSVYLRYQSSGE